MINVDEYKEKSYVTSLCKLTEKKKNRRYKKSERKGTRPFAIWFQQNMKIFAATLVLAVAFAEAGYLSQGGGKYKCTCKILMAAHGVGRVVNGLCSVDGLAVRCSARSSSLMLVLHQYKKKLS